MIGSAMLLAAAGFVAPLTLAKQERPVPSVAPASQTSPAIRSVHLVDRAAEAKVGGSLRGLDQDWSAPGACEVVRSYEFEQPPEPPWFDESWARELAADASAPHHARATIVALDGGSAAQLAGADGGLRRLVAVAARDPLLVVARVRAPAGAKGGGLAVAIHDVAPPEPDALALAVRNLASAELAAAQRAMLPDDHGGEWRELTLLLPPKGGRRCIGVALLPSGEGLLVDRVEVRRLSMAGWIGASPRLDFDRGKAPLARTIDLVDSTCEALLAPAGASLSFAVDVPRTKPRFLFLPGAFALQGGASVDLVVSATTADGAEGFGPETTTVTAHRLREAQALAPVEIDLAPLAGRRVELKIAAKAEADVVATFGAPELLGGPEPTAARARRNLLLISLDTLRADHLGCFGDARKLTPRIDALAAAGLRFAAVDSPSSWTLPTHLAAMTGQHPLVHGALLIEDAMDAERSRPLAARMREQGWCTAAFTAGGPVSPRVGFGLGFERYGIDDPVKHTQLDHDAAQIAAKRKAKGDAFAPVLAWLRAHSDQPFLLFLHTFVVHNYDPQPRFLAPIDDPENRVAGDVPEQLGRLALRDDAAFARMRNLYAACVAEADQRLVGRALAALDELGLAGDTIVCLIADHGEEQREHGKMGHFREVWRESVHVPWILRGPGVPVGAVRDDPVELADVAPTLAALLGLPDDPLVFGRDQLAADPGENAATPRLLLLGAPGEPGSVESLALGPWKVFRWWKERGDPIVKLFQTDADLMEQHDLAATEPEPLRRMLAALDERKRQLLELRDRLPSSGRAARRELTPEELEQLKALGYGR
jgi:arylsulfatase A-like enzyme